MWGEIWTAIALVMVIEGFLPAVLPAQYRSMLLRMVGQHDRVIRTFGLVCMSMGAVIMVCVHWLLLV